MIDNWRDAIVDIAYFASAILFILGLKSLGSPNRARRGNQIAAVGMGIAILATLISRELRVTHNGVTKASTTNYILIIVAIIIGAVVSSAASRRVKMTAMPQMVAIFNGMGGATAALVSVGEFMHKDNIGRGEVLSIVLGTLIGSISFTGSMIAFAKLQELMSGRPITFPSQKLYNAVLFGAIVVVGILVIAIGGGEGSAKALLWLLFVAALVLGAAVVLPIGGADMPVVIAILNSLTGLAAALTGLVLDNQALVIAGALVGASGSYLTLLMGKAMNRSVTNVLFGAFGGGPAPGAAGAAAAEGEALPIRETTADDAAVSLAYAERVIIVPGYGLAVAQAQHAVRELADILEERGVDVRYAIHPVAGRMPGHMNVLLAEADVPYDQLKEMDEINGEFSRTDVSLVIGANDVTNPAANSNPDSPIYGMPILDVDKSGSVIVLKRSMSSGFAGIDNPLFYDPKTALLFGDAKASVSEVLTEVHNL